LSPLGGFAVLGLLMHLAEPQNALVTPTVFFALGAAVPVVVAAKRQTGKQAERVAQQQAERRVARRVTTARVILLVVAIGEALLVALGAHTLHRVNGDIAAADFQADYDSLRTATWEWPAWADAYDRLGDLDHLRGQLGVANASADEIAHRRQAAERQPEFADYWWRLAEAQADAGDYEGAKASYRKALEANPWAADIQVAYAKLLIAHGENAEARRQLEHAVPALPDHREADALLHQLGP
jgi:tetratricopeptide (TPR) repeat protein